MSPLEKCLGFSTGALRPYRYNDIVSHLTRKFNPYFPEKDKKSLLHLVHTVEFDGKSHKKQGDQPSAVPLTVQIGVNTNFWTNPSTTAWTVTVPFAPSSRSI